MLSFAGTGMTLLQEQIVYDLQVPPMHEALANAPNDRRVWAAVYLQQLQHAPGDPHQLFYSAIGPDAVLYSETLSAWKLEAADTGRCDRYHSTDRVHDPSAGPTR